MRHMENNSGPAANSSDAGRTTLWQGYDRKVIILHDLHSEASSFRYLHSDLCSCKSLHTSQDEQHKNDQNTYICRQSTEQYLTFWQRSHSSFFSTLILTSRSLQNGL